MKFSPLDGSNVSDEGSWFYSITLGAEDAESSSSTQKTRSSTQEEVRPSLLHRLQAPPLQELQSSQDTSIVKALQVKIQQKQQSANIKQKQDRHVHVHFTQKAERTS